MPLWLVMSRHNGSMSMTFSFSLSLTHTHAHSSVKASHIPTSVEALWRNWMELPRLLPGSEEYKNTLCTPLAASFSTRFLHKSCAFFFSLSLFWRDIKFFWTRESGEREFLRGGTSHPRLLWSFPRRNKEYFFFRAGELQAELFTSLKKQKQRRNVFKGFPLVVIRSAFHCPRCPARTLSPCGVKACSARNKVIRRETSEASWPDSNCDNDLAPSPLRSSAVLLLFGAELSPPVIWIIPRHGISVEVAFKVEDGFLLPPRLQPNPPPCLMAQWRWTLLLFAKVSCVWPLKLFFQTLALNQSLSTALQSIFLFPSIFNEASINIWCTRKLNMMATSRQLSSVIAGVYWTGLRYCLR